MYRIYPKQLVPELIFQTLEGNTWDLARSEPDFMTLVVFYRGEHCNVCRKYIKEFDDKLNEFTKRGMDVVAVSTDTTDRARKSKEEWGIENLTLGCNLTLDTAQNWGLFISKSIKEKEPEVFSEPGLFLINKDKTLYASTVQTTQFARPHVNDLLVALDHIKKENYPERGEVMEVIEPVGQPRSGRVEF